MTRAQLDKKPVDVASMFDTVAEKYDVTNDVLSLGQDRLWRRAVVKAVDAKPGERILDIAAGTGTSSEPWADREIEVVPADFSLGMLRVGRRRRPDMAFTAADAMSLPFADASFDVVTMSFGLRNVADADDRAARVPPRHQARRRACSSASSASRSTRPSARSTRTTSCGPCPRSRAARRATPTPTSTSPSRSARGRRRASSPASSSRPAGTQVGWTNLTGGVVALHHATKR